MPQVRKPGRVVIRLVDSQPVVCGSQGKFSIIRGEDGELAVTKLDDINRASALVHDAHRQNPSMTFALSRLTGSDTPHQVPIGIFHNVEQLCYDDQVHAQISLAQHQPRHDSDSLQALVNGTDAWLVRKP